MITTTVQVPVTTAEIEAARAEDEAKREAIARQNVRNANRKAGKPVPRVGMSLHVSTARGIKNRGRAGLVFSQTPTEVKVVEDTDTEVAAKQRAGATVVNTWGAEQILADSNGANTGLTLYSASEAATAGKDVENMSDAEAAELEAKLAARRRASVRDPEPRIGARPQTGSTAGLDADKATATTAKAGDGKDKK